MTDANIFSCFPTQQFICTADLDGTAARSGSACKADDTATIAWLLFYAACSATVSSSSKTVRVRSPEARYSRQGVRTGPREQPTAPAAQRHSRWRRPACHPTPSCESGSFQWRMRQMPSERALQSNGNATSQCRFGDNAVGASHCWSAPDRWLRHTCNARCVRTEC